MRDGVQAPTLKSILKFAWADRQKTGEFKRLCRIQRTDVFGRIASTSKLKVCFSGYFNAVSRENSAATRVKTQSAVF